MLTADHGQHAAELRLLDGVGQSCEYTVEIHLFDDIARDVTAAGFEKVTQRVDPWGIFTVSLAVRR